MCNLKHAINGLKQCLQAPFTEVSYWRKRKKQKNSCLKDALMGGRHVEPVSTHGDNTMIKEPGRQFEADTPFKYRDTRTIPG